MNGPEWICWQLPKHHQMAVMMMLTKAQHKALNYANGVRPRWQQPALAFQPAWEGNTGVQAHKHPPSPPSVGGDRPVTWFAENFSICPTLLTAAFEQTTRSPFTCSAVAISPELPIISLSSSKNVGSLETQLSLAEISLSQWVVNAPIMLAFLILCYYYPRLPFSLQRIKRQGFQDPHNGSVHLPAVGQTIPLVFQLYWKPFCCGSLPACVPPLRQCRGASVCWRIRRWFQEHVPPRLPTEPT